VTTASATLHLVNTIAYGGPGNFSLRADTDGSGAQATITASHTNFQTVDADGITEKVLTGAGNDASQPSFRDPAEGDYRQAPGAYTIDAGTDYGGLDIDGDARRIGTTDIGADEFVPASAPPPPAASPAPAPPPAAAPPAPQPFLGVALVSPRLTYVRRYITARLSCPSGTIGRCSGRTTLTARSRASGRRVTLGRAAFSIAPGTRAAVRVPVTRAGRRLLRTAQRLRGRAVNAARDGAGQSKTTAARVTIRPRR
jgi:hypothetical protein